MVDKKGTMSVRARCVLHVWPHLLTPATVYVAIFRRESLGRLRNVNAGIPTQVPFTVSQDDLNRLGVLFVHIGPLTPDVTSSVSAWCDCVLWGTRLVPKCRRKGP